MTKEFSNVSLLNCRLLETSVGCSITIEHDNRAWHEDIQCNVRFHGSHCLSPMFPVRMTRDGRMQMNFVYEDVGEIMAVEVQLISDREDGLYIKWIEITIPKKSVLQRFDVQRWLHPNVADGRTRLILRPNQLPGYEPKTMLGNLHQPKRDYIKYTFFIEISQIKGNIDRAILSIDLIGRYGRTSAHRLNIKSDQIIPLQITSHPNIFELTMLDVGSVYEGEIKLENEENESAYFIANMYLYCGQYYEIDFHQWIENNQVLNRQIQLMDTPISSILLDKVQLKTSFILWITGSELIKKEITVPIKFQLNCQNTVTNPIEETVTIRGNTISVVAVSTACKTPLKSVVLGYARKSLNYCLAKEIVVLDVLQGQYFSFQFDNEPAQSINELDLYSYLPKEQELSLNTKHYIISILTSEKNFSDKHMLKVVLRGERGFTTMMLLQNSSWNDVPFQAKHKDKFLLLASDIGKIKGLTMFHANEEAKFKFDILDILVPHTKTCIRLRGKYEIFNEVIDFSCHESGIVYIVQIKSGLSTLNDTADIILTLIGEESSIEWILLTCDSDTKPFRTGQLDTFYIPSKNLGKIRTVDIRCANVDEHCKWFCETIYVHDTVLNIKSNYLINRWCGDHVESDSNDTSNPTNKTTLTQPASTKLLTTFLMTIKTGVRTAATNLMLTPSIYVFFAGPLGSSPVIHLNELTDRINLFQSSEIDEFIFTIPDTGMPDVMRIWNTEDLTPWTCEYIDIRNLKDTKTVHFPMGIDLQKTDPIFSPYIDLEADAGRVVLPLPGPRHDAAYPSYELILRARQSMGSKEDPIHVQLKGEQNQSKIIRLTTADHHGSTEMKKTSNFYLYGICSLGELKEIFIHFVDNQRSLRSIYDCIFIYDYLMDRYYATKINKDSISHKYRLGIIKDADPRNFNKELDRIEKELVDQTIEQAEAIYRILYKTQPNALTNLTRNAKILVRLLGDSSTSFFPLEHTRQLLSGSFNEYLYRGEESVTELNKIDLQVIDQENTQWACESIEIQNLKTDETIIFPINDTIQSSLKPNQKLTTWKSGVKPGIIYLIRIRTGHQGASLNFRYGSVYLSLKLYGDAGVSSELPVRIPFEQSFYLNCNQTDTFEIGHIVSTVGQISSIDISHNGRKVDSWCIEWINIKDLTTNKSFHFIVEKCLNKDLGTNAKVLHIPADVSTGKSTHDLGTLPNYTIRVKTGAETPLHPEETSEASVVSIVLIDPSNDSMRIPLERINTSARSIFQAGQEDKFDITIPPMLELKVLQIYFNGTFPWYCERMIVTDQISGLSYRFDVERWFRDKTDDNPVNILGQREDDIGWAYSVTVKTQAVLPAQTNLRGKIFLSIYGENSVLNDALLASGRSMYGLFHAGGENTIELKSNKRLGEIHSIELRLEVVEWQSWLCETIEIVDLASNWDFVSRTMIPKNYKFPINRWLGAHAMDKRTVIRSSLNQEPGYAKMPSYIVHILTGGKNMSNESDIHTNVYLQLFCATSNHVYGPILLDKSSSNTQPFRKGQIDEFYINDLSFCGEIKKIRLWHEGGKTSSWHCEWIKITNVEKNEIYEFLVEKILDEDFDEGSSNLILYSAKKEEINEGELSTPRTRIS